ncbi:MAG TPA: CAP domain-containing protein [Chitinophagales bacterium]|nr:CAP domain-containing protein [Chitinophagales bacterium]
MNRIILVIIILLTALSVHAVNPQKYLSYFSSDLIQSAHTAKDIQGLNKEEKEVILWTNLVRLAPTEFSKMLQQYIQEHPEFKWNDPYVKSLIVDLKNTPILAPLYPTQLLHTNANDHALYSQLTQRRGHDNFEQRAQIAFNEKYIAYGENCAYYVRDALHAVVSLLIDKDVPDLGHRKIILDNNFSEIGVAVLPYYNNPYKVVVQEFGTSGKAPYFVKNTYPAPVVQSKSMHTPAPEKIIVKNNSNIQEMYINGKYVKVDTSKFYTWNEYQQYLKNAQKLKSKTQQ